MNENAVIGLYPCEATLLRAMVRRAGRSVEVALSQGQVFEKPEPDASSGAQATETNALRIACLPPHWVISRWWSFPKTDDRTLRQMVAHRLEAELPLPMDQLTWDCRRGRGGPDGTVGVFVQAVRTDLAARQLVGLVEAGQPVSILTTEAEALQALYRYGLKHETDAGTEAVVLAQPKGWLVAVLTNGAIQSLRRLVGTGRMDLAVHECAHAIASHGAAGTVQRIWWLGSPDTAEARSCLAELAGVPVETAEPAPNLGGGNGPLEPADLAAYAPAIGLALAGLVEGDEVIRLAGQREVKRSPRQEQVERLLGQPRRWAIAAGALTLLAIVVHVGAIKLEVGRMETVLAEANKASAAAKDFQPKLQAMQRLQTYRVDIERVFAELAGMMPDTIVISSVQASREGRFVIKGTAKDPKAVFTLTDALQKSKRVQDVKWDRTEPGQGGTFTISMQPTGVTSLNPQGPRGARWR